MVDQRSSTSESGSNDFDLSTVTDQQDLGRLSPVMQRLVPARAERDVTGKRHLSFLGGQFRLFHPASRQPWTS